MFFQLGNKVYQGLYAPRSLNYSGNEANLAEYEIIGGKPRIQHAGETLENVSLSFKLRAEFCNPKTEIEILERWKSEGEILPLLLGNGDYINDYVIKSIEKTVLQTLSDGTLIDVDISVLLIEFVPFSNEAQRAAADREKAVAVGNIEPLNAMQPGKPSLPADANASLLEAQNKTKDAIEAMENAKKNNGDDIMLRTKEFVNAAKKAIVEARRKIENAQPYISNASGIITSLNNLENRISQAGELLKYPLSRYNIGQSIETLLGALSDLDRNSGIFNNDVILRKV